MCRLRTVNGFRLMRRGRVSTAGNDHQTVPGHRTVTVVLFLGLAFIGCSSTQQREAWRSHTATAAVYEGGRGASGTEIGEAFDADSADLYTLLTYAARHNPGVEAAFHRWRAALEGIAPAKAPPDPRFNFGYYFENVETRVGPQEESFGLSQTFPWFGTLRLKGEMAVQDALAAEQTFAAARDRLYFDVVRAWAEYHHLHRSIAIAEEVLALVRDAEAVAAAKYRVGDGPYADLIRAQVELGKLEDRLVALRAMQRPLAAELNASLNRPPDAPLPNPREISDETLGLSDGEIIARVRTDNPSLRSLDFAEARADRAVSLAGRRFYPTFTVGLDYIHTGPARMTDIAGSGTDPVIGRFSINVPLWWGAYRGGKREAEARRRAVVLERQDRENHLLARVHEVLFAYHDAQRKIELYRDALIPKAHQSIEASRVGYKAGEIDFLDYLESQRILLDFEITFARARADRLIRLAELRVLAGDAWNETGG
ncbi:MAG TPA: TolC family protein [Acidobacteriota bacterium]|nr:TolC family protein [Acidobacteriota bacterium]